MPEKLVNTGVSLLIALTATHIAASIVPTLSILVGGLTVLSWAWMTFLFLGMILTPRIPGSIILPPILVTVWTALGAMPLLLLVWGTPFLPYLHPTLFFLTLVWVLVRINTLNSKPGFFLQRRPELKFSVLRSLAVLCVSAVLIPTSLGLYTWGSIDLTLRTYTGDFMRFGPRTLRAAHRTYTKDDKTIDLIAMVHIGKQDYYESILEGLPKEGTLLLEEGVTDASNHLGQGPLYEKLATNLGLSDQPAMTELTDMATRNADVDVNTFAPQTLSLLHTALSVYRADDTSEALLSYAIWAQSQTDQQALLDQTIDDLVHQRNLHLLEELDRALQDHDRIVVPWGAWHHAEISEAVRARGFEEVESRWLVVAEL